MEKNPADRYATAKDLADDLRRYVEDKPIRARRPSLVQRARKWSQRHRAVVRTAAACLLLTVALLAGGAGWVLRDQAARRTETEREAGAALEEAAQWQREGRLPEALAAARRAAWVADAGDASAAFRQRVQARRADLELVAELEEARLQVAVMTDEAGMYELGDRLFAEAFRKAGLDLERLPAEEAAARIRESSVRIELAAALDLWTLIRVNAREVSDTSWRDLLRAARAADPDSWRGRVRDALWRGDRQELVDLARSKEVSRQPLLTLITLASVLQAVVKADGPAEALLREAWAQNPGDFWVNTALGEILRHARPARLDEALCCLWAAVAVRPSSPGAHFNLGDALREKGRVDEAIAEYREGMRLQKDFSFAHNNLGTDLKNKGRLDEAIAEYREAIRLQKDNAAAHSNLGNALREKGQVDEAVAECREAIRLKKDYGQAHNSLGNALREKGRVDEAVAEYQEALRLEKDSPETHFNLGITLQAKGRLDGAIAAYREAIRLKKDFPAAHHNLGAALAEKGRLDEAIAEYQEALRLKKDCAEAHTNLGGALHQKGRLDEAIAEHREAIRLNRDFAGAHYNLGNALSDKGRLDEAIAAYREVIRLKNDCPEAHNNLGWALREKGQLESAEVEVRVALRLNNDDPEALCNLGLILQKQGRFAEALAALKRGHELGSKKPRWPEPSAQWVRETEQLIAMESKLPKILRGEAQPADVAEQVALAEFCLVHKKRYGAAARFYADAFVAQPELAEDLNEPHRYNAASAAALAGCGRGQDADQSDPPERGRLRRQALDWLRADLSAYRKLLEKEADKLQPPVCQRMQHWQQDTDLAGVRDPAALAKLPEAERQQWQTLWQEVEALRQRATGPPKPPKPGGP
jgi:tetratricopeptide (TPR) repeat protein